MNAVSSSCVGHATHFSTRMRECKPFERVFRPKQVSSCARLPAEQLIRLHTLGRTQKVEPPNSTLEYYAIGSFLGTLARFRFLDPPRGLKFHIPSKKLRDHIKGP